MFDLAVSILGAPPVLPTQCGPSLTSGWTNLWRHLALPPHFLDLAAELVSSLLCRTTPTQTQPNMLQVDQLSFPLFPSRLPIAINICVIFINQSFPGPEYSDSDYLGNSSLSETVGVVGGPSRYLNFRILAILSLSFSCQTHIVSWVWWPKDHVGPSAL